MFNNINNSLTINKGVSYEVCECIVLSIRVINYAEVLKMFRCFINIFYGKCQLIDGISMHIYKFSFICSPQTNKCSNIKMLFFHYK